MLQNVGIPSWAVALGAPVLVVAAIWISEKKRKTALDRCKGERQDFPSDSDDEEGEESKQTYIERWWTWA